MIWRGAALARTGDMENRHKKILNMLAYESAASVAQLSAVLGVTKETIRKDLAQLCDSGKITRIHGGAALSDSIPFQVRKTIAEDEKKCIAIAACDMIRDNESIIIESSTTNVLLSAELLKNPEKLQTLTIITNSIRIALLLELGEKCEKLYLLGGQTDAEEGNSFGVQTIEALKHFHADKAFLSAAAFDNQLNVTAYKEHDMLFQREAMLCARETYILVNKKKIPSTALFHVCKIEDVTGIITDAIFPEEQLEKLNKSKTIVISA